MALKGTTAQERAWNFFCAKGLSHYAVSGVMASIRAESGFNPHNLQNSCEKKSGRLPFLPPPTLRIVCLSFLCNETI